MEKLNFKTALIYPFNRATGMLNILWIFVPIAGWFALGGYSIRIVQEFINGEFNQLPTFEFNKDFKLGFFMFIKAIPFMILYAIIISILDRENSLVMDLVSFFLNIFIFPILAINFMNKETVSSFFEFRILKSVFNNLWDYIIVFLKSALLGIIFLLLSIILVGIPAGFFTRMILLADFYRRKVK
jgi:hypothetical protein